jgi:hypothetical protein
MRLPTSQQHSWSWAMRSISPAGSRLARVSWAFTIVVCIPATILSYSKRPFFTSVQRSGLSPWPYLVLIIVPGAFIQDEPVRSNAPSTKRWRPHARLCDPVMLLPISSGVSLWAAHWRGWMIARWRPHRWTSLQASNVTAFSFTIASFGFRGHSLFMEGSPGWK